jgi:hypothetical protein
VNDEIEEINKQKKSSTTFIDDERERGERRRDSRDSRDRDRSRSRRRRNTFSSDFDDDDNDSMSSSMMMNYRRYPQQEQQYPKEDRFSKYDHPNSNPLSITELQMLRNDLQGYKNRGYPITIDIATAPAHLLRTELDLIHENESAEHMVNNMKLGIRVVGHGIEWGNRKLLGSLIPLDNWTEKTFRETPHIYDHSLRRIYNLYMRNSNTNPFAELGYTMAMSAGDHVWTNATSPNTTSTSSSTTSSAPMNPVQSLFGWLSGRSSTAAPQQQQQQQTSSQQASFQAPQQQQQPTAAAINMMNPQQQAPRFAVPPPPNRATSGGRPSRMIRPPFTAGQPPRAEPVTSVPTH